MKVVARGWPWLLVLPATLWALIRLSGLERGLAVLGISFTPYVLLLSLVPLVVTLVARRWWAAGVAGLTCVALAAFVLPRAIGAPSQLDGVPMTVMSANLLFGEADVGAVAAAARALDVDVLVVQELTPGAADGLARAGLADQLPYAQLHPEPGASGTGVYSRLAPTSGGVRPAVAGRFMQAYVVLQPPGTAAIVVESVHPVPPLDASATGLWAGGLRDQIPAGGDPPRILAGDFNATLDHAELRRLMATGYRDAAAEVGAGLTPTWPYAGPRSTVTPKVAIDHVLVPAGVGVRSFDALTVPGTDHRAIVTRLVLPRA